MSSLRPLNTEPSFLHSQKLQSPRDACGAPLRSPSPRVVAGPPKKRMARAGGLFERSLSFKNWEAEVGADEPEAASRCINGARPGTLVLQSPGSKQQQSPRPSPSKAHFVSPRPQAELDDAATKVQKLFKGHRTRRNLADCAIVVEELWWKAYDSASLNIKSISFFDEAKQETAASRWSRAGKRIAKVGKGLSKDEKAQKLALQHWLEAQGKLMYRRSGLLVETTEDSKWIFVLSTTRSLYIGQKKKGKFQHSSFLAGAATTAAGRLVAKDGILKAIWPYSGHYLPTEENFREFISFLEENNVDLANVKRCSVDDDEYPSFKKTSDEPTETEEHDEKPTEAEHDETLNSSQIELPEMDIIKEVVAEDNAEAEAAATKMASLPSFKWATAAGARIGCVRDYPADLQSMALEHVNLSPRVVPSPSANRLPIPSPRPSPKIRLSPRLHYMGLPTPTGRRLPIPSPEIRRQQFMGFQTPEVALTLPKHKAK
ncbi:unnamed protein product [Triticum turgidum subsp. durum]|uniref:Calmodulin-binding family protein n=1 Tax=Triticum turgidum subsp. durum TaxID=4567 RepID=A0A9R0VLQ1_TRITD|nr:unnamed protein product [Triticum turgidum subsp. durum]